MFAKPPDRGAAGCELVQFKAVGTILSIHIPHEGLDSEAYTLLAYFILIRLKLTNRDKHSLVAGECAARFGRVILLVQVVRLLGLATPFC